jgi:hypothetical protein
MQYSFGSGVLYGRSIDTVNATPVRFGALQGVSLDFSFTVKELYGSFQFPIALGRGTGKITGKADFAQINAQAYNDLFFGTGNVATGALRTAVGETATVTANIVTASHNSTFVNDLGVIRSSDGAVFTKVANVPVGTQYACNTSTGVYTFNASQANAGVAISYTYNDANSGKQISITNQLLGTSPQFAAVFTETFNGKSMTIALNACMSSKLSMSTKLEDFTIPAFDFMAFADASNNIGTINTEE